MQALAPNVTLRIEDRRPGQDWALKAFAILRESFRWTNFRSHRRLLSGEPKSHSGHGAERDAADRGQAALPFDLQLRIHGTWPGIPPPILQVTGIPSSKLPDPSVGICLMTGSPSFDLQLRVHGTGPGIPILCSHDSFSYSLSFNDSQGSFFYSQD